MYVNLDTFIRNVKKNGLMSLKVACVDNYLFLSFFLCLFIYTSLRFFI